MMLWIQIKFSCNNNIIKKYLSPTSTAIVQSPCSWTRKTCLRKRYWSRHWRTTLKSEISIVTINNVNIYQIHYHQHICHYYHLETWSPTDKISELFLKKKTKSKSIVPLKWGSPTKKTCSNGHLSLPPQPNFFFFNYAIWHLDHE